MIEETQKVRAVQLIRTGKAPRGGTTSRPLWSNGPKWVEELVLTEAGMKSYQAAYLVTSTHLLITTKSIDDVHLKSSATHAITIAGRVDTRREWNQSASRGIEELAVLNHSSHGEQIIPPACQR